MIKFPPAKINLGLNVLYKRSDGYHEIDTCMIPIGLSDVLEVLPSGNFQFIQTGLSVDGDVSDNLVVRAYELLSDIFNIPPVYVHLRKNIPMGAGLGGGSSDASYMLLMLNELFELKLNNEEIRKLAVQLGSDCPFFVENKPQLGKGRGDVLSPVSINLSGYFLKLIFPGIHINTKDAYSNLSLLGNKQAIESIVSAPIELWKNQLNNDFEETVFKLHPSLKDIKNELYDEGAVYASMTGSGSTLYGIFEEKPEGCVVINL